MAEPIGARKTRAELRSARWYLADDMRAFAHRQRTQQMGVPRADFMERPVVAVVNTWSELSPCHIHLRDRAEAVKDGIRQAALSPVAAGSSASTAICHNGAAQTKAANASTAQASNRRSGCTAGWRGARRSVSVPFFTGTKREKKSGGGPEQARSGFF